MVEPAHLKTIFGQLDHFPTFSGFKNRKTYLKKKHHHHPQKYAPGLIAPLHPPWFQHSNAWYSHSPRGNRDSSFPSGFSRATRIHGPLVFGWWCWLMRTPRRSPDPIFCLTEKPWDVRVKSHRAPWIFFPFQLKLKLVANFSHVWWQNCYFFHNPPFAQALPCWWRQYWPCQPHQMIVVNDAIFHARKVTTSIW